MNGDLQMVAFRDVGRMVPDENGKMVRVPHMKKVFKGSQAALDIWKKANGPVETVKYTTRHEKNDGRVLIGNFDGGNRVGAPFDARAMLSGCFSAMKGM